MNNFKKKSITTDEVLKWKRDKLLNPRTKRRIKENSRLYKFIKNEYLKKFPLNIDVFDSLDSRISLKLSKQGFSFSGKSSSL